MPTQNEIDLFISSLLDKDNTIERRAYAFHYIKKYNKEINQFLDNKIKRSGASLEIKTWVKKIKKRIDYYSVEPKNHYFDEYGATLKTKCNSFYLSNSNHPSLTFNSTKKFIRIIGYCISLVIFLFFSYLCYSTYNYMTLVSGKYQQKIINAIP